MELEEVKSHYRNKITEMEAAAKKQERKGNECKNKNLARHSSIRIEMVSEYSWLICGSLIRHFYLAFIL